MNSSSSNSSRNAILSALTMNKPEPAPLPGFPAREAAAAPVQEKFIAVAQSVGSQVYAVKNYQEIKEKLEQLFPDAPHTIAKVKESSLLQINENALAEMPHNLAGVDLAILRGKLGVAENSSIWITEEQMGQRVLPFVCQHLALIISQKEIVSSMHEAYQLIGEADYGYGVFIAGPSKTADIEQSLVLGAHGPRSLTVFLLED